MTNLLPCPFCGGEAYIGVSSDGYGVSCINDKCIDMLKLDAIPTEAEAIEAWNTRAEQTIVRCKDCQYSVKGEPHPLTDKEPTLCTYLFAGMRIVVSENGFCAWGEPREGSDK